MKRSLPQWLAHLEELHPEEIELGLERIQSVMLRAGLNENLPVLITVAGTNGKGSVVEYLTHAFCAAGHKVGSYTSPHLHRFNERVRVNGDPVSDETLCAAFADIDAARQQTELTYFEFSTLAAMRVFLDQSIDVAVLEVGLGGRLDAVNCWDADCAVITSIAIDHEAWLGDDREVIGYEKAGIARPGKPLVVGESQCPQSIISHAASIAAQPYYIGQDFTIEAEQGDGSFNCRLPDSSIVTLPMPGLSGAHQRSNAAVAVTVMHLLSSRLTVAKPCVQAAIAEARVAGRMQELQVGGTPILLDVAHNPAAALRLAESLKDRYRGESFIAVFAAMADKDLSGLTAELSDCVSHWYCADLDIARALPAVDAAAHCKLNYPLSRVDVFASVQGALEAARQIAVTSPTSNRVLVFGSFFTVADALACLQGELGSAASTLDGVDGDKRDPGSV